MVKTFHRNSVIFQGILVVSTRIAVGSTARINATFPALVILIDSDAVKYKTALQHINIAINRILIALTFFHPYLEVAVDCSIDPTRFSVGLRIYTRSILKSQSDSG
jgi:hypothetical protein